MARRKLTLEQENWLFLHYTVMTNKELSMYLTQWVENENKKQLERLNRLLKEDFSDGARKVITKKIDALNKFNGISVPLVKRYARELHCRPKTREHIVSCNKEKAKATNIKRWMKKAEKVDNIMEWLRTFDEKDMRVCIMDEGKVKSFQTSINKFNRDEGYAKGIYLASKYIPDAKLLRVHASSYRNLR